MAKTLDAIDLGAELGAEVFVMWGGREGVEADAAKDVRRGARPLQGGDRPRAASTSATVGYGLRIALEPKPNEPRGDIFLPTVGHALAFIGELEWPDMVGLNPSSPTRRCAGLNFTHGVAQALWHGKLFHIDLNAQRIGKFDQDFRFGSEGSATRSTSCGCSRTPGWDGMRHFDAHPYRTEDAEGVWEFAAGCMRTYLILKREGRAHPRGRGDPRRAAGSPRSTDWPNRRLPVRRSTQIRQCGVRRGRRSPRRATATSASTSS